MTALTKSELADRLHERLGLNKREAKKLVEQFFEEIRICLENNEQVSFQDSVILIFAIRGSALVATPRPERRFLSLLAGS